MLGVHRRPSRVLVIDDQDRMRLSEALSVATRLLTTRIRTLETCPEAGQFHTMELRGIAERDLAALSNLAAALRDD